jgi:hypothetical protein
MSSQSNEAYNQAATAIGGLYQRFLYGFGGQLEVLLTLLQKQHWQAAADIMPLIERERVSFEGVLLSVQSELAEKATPRQGESRTEDSGNDAGPVHGEAPNFGEPQA